MALPAPHSLDADGNGYCLACPLPPGHSVHIGEAAAPHALPPRPRTHQTASVALDGTATSHLAAIAAQTGRGQVRAAVLALLDERGPMTDDEMEVALDCKHQTLSSARNALLVGGDVAALVGPDHLAITRPTRSGNKATVWQLTDQGRARAHAAA